MLLYTDGVIEAANSAGEFFGSDRLTAAVLKSSPLPVEEAVETMVQQVKDWSAAQEDDITVLLCEFVDHQ